MEDIYIYTVGIVIVMKFLQILTIRLFLHVTCIYDYVILCHCTLAAALYFEQSSCDELMEFKHSNEGAARGIIKT